MSYLEPALLHIVGRRHAAELLGELADRPDTVTGLRTRLHTTTKSTIRALRELAALGAVRGRGTWDDMPHDGTRYELTPQGADWAADLNRYDVWVAICEHCLQEPDPSDT